MRLAKHFAVRSVRRQSSCQQAPAQCYRLRFAATRSASTATIVFKERESHAPGYPAGVLTRSSLKISPQMWRGAMSGWSPRRWYAAVLSGLGIGFLIALPTAVIPNPIFGRAIETTWWSYPTVVCSALLGGILIATYVRESLTDPEVAARTRTTHSGLAHWVDSFLSSRSAARYATNWSFSQLAPVVQFLGLPRSSRSWRLSHSCSCCGL